MKLWVACIAGLLIVGSVFAQDKPDPLEAADKACMDKASSTASMSECADASYKRWDQELNRVYGALRGKLKTPAQAALKESQREWLAYRDAENKTIGAVYHMMQGTMYVPMRASDAAEIVKARVKQLRGYLSLFTPQDQ
jgi:uncharacterized protein YecT (DUF1311 family)